MAPLGAPCPFVRTIPSLARAVEWETCARQMDSANGRVGALLTYGFARAAQIPLGSLRPARNIVTTPPQVSPFAVMDEVPKMAKEPMV